MSSASARFGAGLLVVLSALLSACSRPPPPPPPTLLSGEISVADDVNPDTTGRPSPVMVRLYELRSPAPLLAADYFDLATREQEQAVLGQDLKAREEWLLQPGTRLPLDRRLDPETRAVGFVAAFRELGGAVWRSTAPVVANRTNGAAVSIRRNTLSIEVTPR